MTLKEAKEYTRWVFFYAAMGLGIVFFVSGVLNIFNVDKDDTDPPGMGERSGMKLYIDHKMGCQYLTVPKVGLTPRINFKGQHEGCEK